MKKALVKETGQIIDIEDRWSVHYVSFSLDFENVETIKLPEMLTYTHGYLTSDGQKFHEDDVIVGLDEIREYKIKNNLEI